MGDILIQTLSANLTKPHSHEEKSAKQGIKLLGALMSEAHSAFDHMAGCYSLVLALLMGALKSASSTIKCGALTALASLGKSTLESMSSEVLRFDAVQNELLVHQDSFTTCCLVNRIDQNLC